MITTIAAAIILCLAPFIVGLRIVARRVRADEIAAIRNLLEEKSNELTALEERLLTPKLKSYSGSRAYDMVRIVPSYSSLLTADIESLIPDEQELVSRWASLRTGHFHLGKNLAYTPNFRIYGLGSLAEEDSSKPVSIAEVIQSWAESTDTEVISPVRYSGYTKASVH